MRKSLAAFLLNNIWVKSVKQEFAFSDPDKLREKNLLFQIQAAESHGKLFIGIKDIWNAASQKKGKLLVGEKKYLFPGVYNDWHSGSVLLPTSKNEAMPINDAVDTIIEKVMEEGGNIEFVDNGKLHRYKHMVMIQLD